MKIVKYPAKSLLKPSLAVSSVDMELLEWTKKFVEFTQQPLWGNLLGMAAPQVGRNIRLFIAMGRIYVNPVLKWYSKAPMDFCLEGCYSLEEKKYDYPTRRYVSIILQWEDLTGAKFEERFNGKKAQVIQHELDHLDGKLCVSLAELEKSGIITKETKTNDRTGNKRLASKVAPRKG